MPDFESPEIKFACDAVKTACRVAQQVQGELETLKLSKEDRSPVTVADFAGQAVIGYKLMQCFPDEILVGEENAATLREKDSKPILEQVCRHVQSIIAEATLENVCTWIDRGASEPGKRFWTVDPIDGTKGFLRGDHYAVALALIENGEVKLGVLGCPHLAADGSEDRGGRGALLVAAKGKGAWSRPLEGAGEWTRLHVSDRQDPAKLRILRSVERAHTKVGRTQDFCKELGIQEEPIPMDSQAKYAVLASGRAEAFFYFVPSDKPHFRMKIWDVAPGAIVVEEAGGRTSDMAGKTLDFSAGRTMANNPGLLITNGHLHDFTVEALNRVNQS